VQRFSRLYQELDTTTGTAAKVDALRRYFDDAPPADAAWATYFLAGGKPQQVVPTALLRTLACEQARIEDWLFEACYQAVGDLAETIALVLPAAPADSGRGLASWIEDRLLPLRGLPPAEQVQRVIQDWSELDAAGRFLLVKLIGGGFRVGVSRLLVQRALAAHAGIDPKTVAQRMMGTTDRSARPSAERFAALISQQADSGADAGQPYPFFLAHALNEPVETFASLLGEPPQWLVEWKYDGIRAQIVRRRGAPRPAEAGRPPRGSSKVAEPHLLESAPRPTTTSSAPRGGMSKAAEPHLLMSQVWIWSRGEELVTDRFPEVQSRAMSLPDGCVLDGEILVWKDDRPAPFQLLQQRIGRKLLTKKVLADAPVVFLAYDLLEWQGIDIRAHPQHERRRALEAALANGPFDLSPAVSQPDWPALAALREESRGRGVEGFMLKKLDAAYGIGRTKADGVWWKWKIEPLTVDAVLIYAQAGHGRRASVYTDYTFAVWSRPPADAAEAQAVVEAIARREPAQPGALQLVPFAKAYSGLTDEEFTQVDKVIRATTLERSVKPTMVFELGFEAINRSTRHKSGIAVRFPRMLRIRSDKPLHEADDLGLLERMLGVTRDAGL
jgi:DNA ligase 1